MALRFAGLAASVAFLWSGVAQADIAVVTSIKPVHSLVSAVMEGAGTPTLLVDGASSPHAFSLRPSAARSLSRADVVFWVDEGLEGFLVRPIASLAGDATVIKLLDTPGLTLLDLREGGTFDAHDHGHGADDHGHDAVNPHVWLDPKNAAVMVDEIARAMAEADPDNAALYRRNAAETQTGLAALTDELTARLEPVRGARFVVFHDAYPYLEARFGVEAAGAITLRPELSPGAAQLGEIRSAIEALDVRCVFAEPQFEPRLVTALVDGTGATVGTLDPLGVAAEAGPDHYAAMMRANATALLDCLSPPA